MPPSSIAYFGMAWRSRPIARIRAEGLWRGAFARQSGHAPSSADKAWLARSPRVGWLSLILCTHSLENGSWHSTVAHPRSSITHSWQPPCGIATIPRTRNHPCKLYSGVITVILWCPRFQLYQLRYSRLLVILILMFITDWFLSSVLCNQPRLLSLS